jgi:cysteine-rich repeat protein
MSAGASARRRDRRRDGRRGAAVTFGRQVLVGSLALAALLAACSGKTTSSPVDRICTPGAYVYCRCQDRQEGTKLCKEDGASFGLCEPCETAQNPVDPTVPPDPVIDAGVDAPATPPKCGNSIPEYGEACDDGNADDSDGCDRTCALAGADPSATRSCPGLDVHVWGTSPVVYTGSTSTSANTGSTPTCPSAEGNFPTTGAAANDRVFYVTVHATGTLVVTVSDVSYDAYVYASDGCSGALAVTPYLACSNKTTGVGGEVVQLPVQAGKSYSVFVDGAGISGNTGSFRVTFTLQ